MVRFLLERITAGNHGTAAEAEAEAAATDKRQCRAAVVRLILERITAGNTDCYYIYLCI